MDLGIQVPVRGGGRPRSEQTPTPRHLSRSEDGTAVLTVTGRGAEGPTVQPVGRLGCGYTGRPGGWRDREVEQQTAGDHGGPASQAPAQASLYPPRGLAAAGLWTWETDPKRREGWLARRGSAETRSSRNAHLGTVAATAPRTAPGACSTAGALARSHTRTHARTHAPARSPRRRAPEPRDSGRSFRKRKERKGKGGTVGKPRARRKGAVSQGGVGPSLSRGTGEWEEMGSVGWKEGGSGLCCPQSLPVC